MDEVGGLVELLEEVGFEQHRLCIERDHPEILIGTYRWDYHIDVVIVIGEQHAHAYRVSASFADHVLAPIRMSWHRRTSAVKALRAVLALPPPGHPKAPSRPLTPPHGSGQLICSRLPRGWRP
jgi:hypothetical protein